MKCSWPNFARVKSIVLVLLLLTTSGHLFAQSVPFPTETPPYNEISPWGYEDKNQGWDTSPYLPFIYQGTQFRIVPPNGVHYNSENDTWSYDDPTKEYPLMVYSMGAGGRGMDNTVQLKKKNDIGQRLANAVASDDFPGFVVFWQTELQYISADKIASLVNGLIAELNIDQNRVYASGRSRGATMTWEFTRDRPEIWAATLSISGASGSFFSQNAIHVPVRLAQGGLDKNPTPDKADDLVELYEANGGNMEYLYYPTNGHSTWNPVYKRSDFYSWFLEKKKNDLHVFGGFTKVCPGDPVNIKMGFTGGFSGYEWRKDGVLIAGATSNNYTATSFGSYTARFRRGAVWTDWSDPIEIGEKETTITPPIQVNGLQSHVIPSADGSSSVELMLPEGYASYVWKQVGSETVLGTERIFTTSTPGDYIASVAEFGGCSSVYSDAFTVVNANGPDAPDNLSNFKGTASSQTSIVLTWDQNPTPGFNETAFELLRSETTGGPYQMVGIANQDADSFEDTGLEPNSTYYYIARAINGTAAAAVSEEIVAVSELDEQAPTAPGNVRVMHSTSTTVTVQWDASIDNVAVFGYDVYLDGVKFGATPNTSYIVNGLANQSVHAFSVKARDESGNISVASEQVVGAAIQNGLLYSYYEGEWTNLPNFDALTPIKTGSLPNFSLSPAESADHFGFKFDGTIDIPEDGEYTFYLKSDDGSRLYIDGIQESNVVVNYDGTHGAGERNGTINLTAGLHSIRVIYFESVSGNSLQVRWKSNSISKQLIPNSAFAEEFTYPTPPAAPQNIVATAVSYQDIDLTWVLPNASAENVEIYRKSASDTDFSIINTVPAAQLSYSDTGLDPSTSYEYALKSTSSTGSSGLVPFLLSRANWNVNNNVVDDSGEGQILQLRNGLTFSTDSKEGSHALSFDGTNDYARLNNNGDAFFINEFYERSVAFWIKPNNISNEAVLYDEGGSTNGIAIRLKNGNVEASVRNGGGGSQRNLSAPAALDVWTHVAMVFDNGLFQLFINGVLADENADTGYAKVSRHTNSSELGKTTGSNSFGTKGVYYKGLMDAIYAFDTGLSGDQIASLIGGSHNAATTFDLPPAPLAPSNLISTEQTNMTLALQWDDNSSDETGFEVYRSIGDASNFVLQAEVPASNGATASFTDEGLFPHTQYFYKVLAKNVGGSSADSNELSVATTNSLPVIPSIDDLTVRFDENKNIVLTVTDADGDPLALNSNNLPAFAEFFDYGDGEGELIITPDAGSVGVYNNLSIEAIDGFGGVSVENFNLEVNSNYSPVMDPFSNLALKEGENGLLVISATDGNGDNLTWSLQNEPSFVTYAENGSDQLEITVAPGLTDAGTFEITVQVSDGQGGVDSEILTIDVQDFDPNYLVYVNFGNNSPAASPWNNAMTTDGASGFTLSNLVNEDNIVTDIAVSLESNWGGASTTGGKTPGVYPNAVMQSYVWFTNSTQQVKISGLNAGYLYNLSFMASRNSNGDRTTTFASGGSSASVNATQNTGNLAVLNGLSADVNGEILVTVTNGPSATYSYMNAVVIESVYQDGTAPAAPENLMATVSAENNVDLTWDDIAYNESGYKIFRTILNGAEELVATIDANAVSYSDATALGHSTYSYRVASFNDNGDTYSAPIEAITNNNAAAFVDLNNVAMIQGNNVVINITATDKDGDAVNIELQSGPAFAAFVSGAPGSGLASVTLTPGVDDLGTFPVTLRAIDLDGSNQPIATTVASFDVTVTNTEVLITYVNFNNGSNEPSPWNNFNAAPNANATVSGLLYEDGSNAGYSIRMVEAWKGDNALGVVTGDDSGIYPDNVMQTAFWESTNVNRTMVISGLQNNKLYDLDFFSSRAGDGDRTTIFNINGVEKSVNAAYNSSNTANFVGLSSSGGEITVAIRRSASAAYFYLNAMVIKEYEDSGIPIQPSNLTSDVLTQSSIELNWDDNANNETGYELMRSVGDNSNFQLLTTLAANATSYEDTGLTSNTTYVYKVRAIGVSNSPYSNETSASTFEYAVFVNMNDFDGAPAPWNNIVTYMVTGDVVNGLNDDLGNPTNISMTMVQEFQGDNSFGMNTGNNSGVVPDAVLNSSYWLDPGQFATIKLSGLSFVHSYNISFIASRDGGGNRNTDYTVNGQTVTLNASYNTTNTVQLKDITPDINGDVEIRIATSAGSNFGYLNGFIIQAARLPESASSKVAASSKLGADNRENIVDVNNALVYPNPFTDALNIQLNAVGGTGSVQLVMFNSNGQKVVNQKRSVDANAIQLDLKQFNLKKGIYLLNIINEAGENNVYRIIKK